LSGETENIVFTRQKSGVFCSYDIDRHQFHGRQMFLQVTRGYFVHMILAPAMIGYMCKMFCGFVGITPRQRTMFFVRGQLSKILNMFDRPTHCFGTKVFRFFYPQTMDFCPKTFVCTPCHFGVGLAAVLFHAHLVSYGNDTAL
jgi:hypothetical protein